MILNIDLKVLVAYDDEAGVWYVRETSVPGVYADAETPEDLAKKLFGMAADLCVDEDNLPGTEAVVTLNMDLVKCTLVQTEQIPVFQAA